MTLVQQAYSMIDALPDDESLRQVIHLLQEYSQSLHTAGRQKNDDMTEKRKAFMRLEEMRKRNLFPKDYDCEAARREAVEEKYIKQHERKFARRMR